MKDPARDGMEPPPQPEPPGGPHDPILAALEQRLGVVALQPEVAVAALTHKSFVNEHRGEGLQDNERLEFLGDAVIDLAVSQRLMERFPEAREGELSKIRAAVVDEAGLAFMARELDLGTLLRLGRGEELTGGRQKSSLLADAMEAVIAALYLAGGLDPVLAVIDRFLGESFARAAAGTLDRDYKTQFQELAQSRLRATPRYRVVAEHGPDHSKIFEVELDVRGEPFGRGAGRSKKDAEQAAAKLGLELIQARTGEAQPPAAAPAVPEVVPVELPGAGAVPIELASDAAPPASTTAEPVPAATGGATPATAPGPLPQPAAGLAPATVVEQLPVEPEATALPRRGPARKKPAASPRTRPARKKAAQHRLGATGGRRGRARDRGKK
jgi:ribonuclease-3